MNNFWKKLVSIKVIYINYVKESYSYTRTLLYIPMFKSLKQEKGLKSAPDEDYVDIIYYIEANGLSAL